MTCTVSEDPYAIAEGMIQEEADLMRKMVDLAKERATMKANTNGWGPNRTDAYVKSEMRKARDNSHDRALLRQIAEGKVDPSHAKAHNLSLSGVKRNGESEND